MNSNQFLAKRLREVFLNGYWIANTNYKNQLKQITWQQALQKPLNLNSIAALTFHVNYYLNGILEALNIGVLNIKDQYSFDMPIIKSEEEWNSLVDNFLANAESFACAVELMDEKILNSYFFDEKYGTYHRNIEGVIEHGYYHLGQISLLRKMAT